MNEPKIISRDHYAYVTRSAIRLFNQGALTHVSSILVEPEYGYTMRLTYDNGSFRVTYGNDLGLNSAAACALANDKGHTKFMLRRLGVNTPKGSEFLLPWWTEQIAESQKRRGNVDLRTTDDAATYIERDLGYPVYMKPVSGSKGSGVVRVDNLREAQIVFDSYARDRARVAVVEEVIDMPDYRVVVLDGALISAYLRKPLAVTGDGVHTVKELIDQVQQKYINDGRETVIDPFDIRITQTLGKLGLSQASKPPQNETISLTSISNLSAGGTSEDVTYHIHKRWKELAVYIAANFNLRLCGLDLACSDITKAGADYSVLEVNAYPGLDHYVASGKAQQKVVDELYTKVLNTYPTLYA